MFYCWKTLWSLPILFMFYPFTSMILISFWSWVVSFWMSAHQWGSYNSSFFSTIFACWFFVFLLKKKKEGILLVSPAWEQNINPLFCSGTTRSKQTCLFTCEFTQGRGDEAVSKSERPGQRKQLHVFLQNLCYISAVYPVHGREQHQRKEDEDKWWVGGEEKEEKERKKKGKEAREGEGKKGRKKRNHIVPC